MAISSGRRICQAQSVNLAVGSAMRICQAQCRRSSGGRQLQEDRLCVVQEIIWRPVAIEGSVRRSAGGHLAAGSYRRIAYAQYRRSSGGRQLQKDRLGVVQMVIWRQVQGWRPPVQPPHIHQVQQRLHLQGHARGEKDLFQFYSKPE